jgi:ferric-dicitrate binding protein FerR (iron transport regulator)
MNVQNEADFEKRARERFDVSVDALDARTLSQLNRARQAAVAEIERRERTGLRAWSPAGALAAATAALAVMLWQYPQGGGLPDDVAAASAALAELPASDEDLDLVSEDPEFYAWAQQASLVMNGTG